MKKDLLFRGITKYLLGLVLMIILIFVPAGSFFFFNGYLLLGLLFIPMLIIGVVLFIKDPELLEKRLNAKETENEQKRLLLQAVLCFFQVL